MLRNYILVAIRGYIRNKTVTTVNVIGLCVAMTATLIIFQYAIYHFNFDKTDLKSWQEIYRLGYDWQWMDDWGITSTKIPGAYGDVIQRLPMDFPEVEETTWFMKGVEREGLFDESVNDIWIYPSGFGKDPLKTTSFISADSNYFRVFDFKVKSNNKQTILSEPNSVVLSSRMAQNLFASDEVIGKLLFLKDRSPRKITGVYYPSAQNTLNFDVILSVSERMTQVEWGYETFLRVSKNANRDLLFRKINDKYLDYYASDIEEYNSRNPQVSVIYHRMDEVHFDWYGHMEVLGNITYRREVFLVLMAIGLVISAIAMVNYLNLTNAQLISRVREMGIRKVIGASGRHLYVQHMMETILTLGLSFVLALTATQFVQPLLENMGLDVNMSYLLSEPTFYLLMLTSIVGISAVIAYVKSILFTRIAISNSLKGDISNKKMTNHSIQNLLIGFQMICTVGLTIGMVIVNDQIGCLLEYDLGYSSENVLVIDAPENSFDKIKVKPFLNSLNELSSVESVSASLSYPGERGMQFAGVHYQVGKDFFEPLDGNGPVEANFTNFFDIDLLAGRTFRSDYSPDNTSILLSEEAVRQLGFRSVEEALNSRVGRHFWWEEDSSQHKEFKVIGVFKDYYTSPLNEMKGPGLALTLPADHQSFPFRYFYVKFRENEFRTAVLQVKEEFDQHFANTPFDFFIHGEAIRSGYARDELIRSILFLFGSISVAISFMGIFALLSMVLIRRTKEIGIRKILGANFKSLFGLFAKKYFKLVGLTGLLVIPMTWIFADEWLNNYMVRVELNWFTFTWPLIVLLIMLTVLLFLVIRNITCINPIKSLRYE